MYLLLKERQFNGFSDKAYFIVKRAASLETITQEIEKRVKDGCPVNTLHVVKEVDFNLSFTIGYEEDTTCP